ncbi:MAG: hypothetical protein ACK5QC_00955 [Bacteroidota bacterium]|nr:hypothetical protein [Bacteroidota bacterium]
MINCGAWLNKSIKSPPQNPRPYILTYVVSPTDSLFGLSSTLTTGD